MKKNILKVIICIITLIITAYTTWYITLNTLYVKVYNDNNNRYVVMIDSMGERWNYETYNN